MGGGVHTQMAGEGLEAHVAAKAELSLGIPFGLPAG